MARCRRSEQARRDAVAIWVYVAERDISAADRLLDTFDAKLKILAKWPGLGAGREELGAGIRSFPVGNYLILYRKAKGGIELVRLVHAARDLRPLFRRRRPPPGRGT